MRRESDDKLSANRLLSEGAIKDPVDHQPVRESQRKIDNPEKPAVSKVVVVFWLFECY